MDSKEQEILRRLEKKKKGKNSDEKRISWRGVNEETKATEEKSKTVSGRIEKEK